MVESFFPAYNNGMDDFARIEHVPVVVRHHLHVGVAGAHLAAGEEPLAAAKRELREETGVVVSPVALSPAVHAGRMTCLSRPP